MNISVIIPTCNEEANIGDLVDFAISHGGEYLSELIVVDGGSTDNTVSVAQKSGAKVLQSTDCSRAKQMNIGAAVATGDILFFVHADVKLLESFAQDVILAVNTGFVAGCYRYRFDSPSRLLRFNAYMTRFRSILCRGGDQTLFITRRFFDQLGGFDEKFVIMEDYDIIRRICREEHFHIIPKEITVSARKYEKNSWLWVQICNITAFLLYFMRTDPKTIKAIYGKMIG